MVGLTAGVLSVAFILVLAQTQTRIKRAERRITELDSRFESIAYYSAHRLFHEPGPYQPRPLLYEPEARNKEL